MPEDVKPVGYVENESLLPIPINKRLYGTGTFTWMMFSMNVCIPLFFLGSIGLQLGLSIIEAALGAFLGESSDNSNFIPKRSPRS